MNTVERRVHPNCVYKSNPYHECIEACFEHMPQQQGNPNKKSGNSLNIQLVVPKRLSFRKKNKDSNSADKITLNPKSSSHHQLDSPSSNSSPVEFSFNKVESWNCDVTTLSPKKQHTGVFEEVISSKQQEQEEEEGLLLIKELEFDSMRSTLTDQSTVEEESDDADCSRRVAIGNYFVKESVSGILPSILNKYGDIAENCTLQSVALRSYYLECLCFIVLELLQSSSTSSSNSNYKLKEMLSIVKDAGCVGIDVGWLSPVVDRMGKVMELIKQRKAFQEEKRQFDLNVVDSVRKELQVKLQVLAEKEEAASVARAGVEEIQGRVREMEEECFHLSERMKKKTLLLESSNSSKLLVELTQIF